MRSEFEFLAAWVRFIQAKTVVEIGVLQGDMAVHLAKAVKDNGGHYYGFDMWDRHGMAGQFPQVGSIESVGDRLRELGPSPGDHGISPGPASVGNTYFTLHRIDTLKDLPQFEEILDRIKSIDFAFIDGDHSYLGIASDFRAVYPRLGVGGVIAFHDTLRIDGCREFVLDLRTKYDDRMFDIFDLPWGGGDRRCGVTLLVKKSFSSLDIGIDEVCGSLNSPYDIEYKQLHSEVPSSSAVARMPSNEEIKSKMDISHIGYYADRKKFAP